MSDTPNDSFNNKTCLVVLSGGQDSTTCLFFAKTIAAHVHAITFDYGQRHSIELESAKKVAELAKVESHEIVTIPNILHGSSPLVSNNQLDMYENYHVLPGGVEKTFVPMRNPLFLTIAANRAVVLGAQTIMTGVSQEDYGGYADCRETFIHAMSNMIDLALGEAVAHPPEISTPLMHMSKAEEVKMACGMKGCMYALAHSHTAYDGKYPPNGRDHASLLRAKGFEEAGVPDPLVVRAWTENLMPLPLTPNYNPYTIWNYAEEWGLMI